MNTEFLGPVLVCLWLLGFLGGLAWNLVALSRAIRSQRWTRIDCEILESYVKKGRGDDYTTYPFVSYKYIVNGSQYQGKTIKYGGMWASTSTTNDYCSKYSSGKIVKLSVDPNDPKKSVLEPGASSYLYSTIIVLIVCSAVAFTSLLYAF